MKNKENSKQKKIPDKNKSLTNDYGQKRSNFSSMIFESGRNSLCSPRQTKNMPDDKYQTYIQFISSGKFTPDIVPQKPNYFYNKGKSVTPMPKRISTSLLEQGRISAGKQNSKGNSINKSRSRQQSKSKSPLSKYKPLFVKGSNIVKALDGNVKNQSKGKQIRPVSAKKHEKVDKKEKVDKSSKTVKNDEKKQEEKQKKLIAKLFTGIQFHRVLGKGAHALVKSGVDWNNKRKIAIKIYDKNHLQNNELRSIKREVQILGSLDNQNIIKLYQIIQSYKTINLIMEYGGGNSVDQYLRNKKNCYLQQDQAKQIFRDVLVGVAYLHQHKIAHRDIKTQNILLNKYLKVKIIDFGFSLKLQKNSIINNYCGTPTYMPPEVVTKTPHNPFLADRWSLGILLYTMLNGHCPFKAQNQKQLFIKICEGEYQFQSYVSNEAKDFIKQFLTQNAQQRISPEQALLNKWLIK